MRKVKLGNVLKLKHGYAFKSEHYVDKSEFMLVTLANFTEDNNFRLNTDKATYYGADFPKSFILQENDLIMPLTEQVVGLFGNTAFIPKEKNITFVLNQRVAKVIPDEEKVDKYFLHFLLSTNYIREQLEYRANGTKQRNISPDDVYDVEAYLPDIDVQREIGHFLYNLECRINNNKKIIKDLYNIVNTTFIKWFINYDFPGSDGKFKYDKNIKDKIPFNWETKKISDIESNIITGKTPSTSKRKYYDGNIPFVTIDDIRKAPYIVSTNKTLSKSGAESQKKKYIPNDSLCVTCIATVGLVGITTEFSQTNQQINSIVCENKNNLYFLFSSIENYFKYSSGAKDGNIFKNMNKDDFSNIYLVYPPLDILKKYYDVVSPLFNKMKLCEFENKQFEDMKKKLTPLLLYGQIKMED